MSEPKESALRLEGGLFGPEFLALLEKGTVPFQTPRDFGLPRGRSLQEEIAESYREAKTLYALFRARLERALGTEAEGEVTRERWVKPFLSLLGYRLSYRGHAEAGDRKYEILYRADEMEEAPPVHVVPWGQDLSRATRRGRSPHGLLQDYLNASEHLWGLVTNGRVLRLLRKTPFVRRQAYLEVDLEALMEEDRFGEFALVYRLLHRSRLPRDAATAHEAPVERYHLMAVEQGERVREGLREAVEGFLQELGTGFLRGPMGEELARDPEALYHDLLRLAYRVLFLLVAEARGVLGGDEVYREAFGLHRLLRLSERREAYTEDPDLWLGLKTLFELLRNPGLRVNGAPAAEALGLGVLNGGLFGERLRLEEAPFSVENRHLLAAFRRLALFYDPEARTLKRVNYAALDVEELGSVYESLLDHSPQVVWEEGGWAFRFARGSERKRTGSYYTPHELVDLVLKEALDPVVEARLKAAGDDPKAQEAALLSLKVLDPAAGSGHFLLGAARRLGRRLAQIRTGEEEPSPEAYREAVRDVVQNCLYAVDKNPLAVELCRMALWMESYVPGKPLSFLDHRVKCGDSLVGVLDPKVLVEGIPDGAYEAKEGDDRRFAREAREANRRERAGAQGLFDTDFFTKVRRKGTWRRLLLASHLWTAAFFQPLRRGEPFITSRHVREVLKGGRIPEAVEALAHVFAERHRFFHWWLEFSDVFQKGGFDVVLGNPPWERLEGETHFYRRSGAYPLTSSVSSLNTYLLFLERILALRRGDGFIGLLVPTGIGTDAGGKALFQHLWNGGFLQRLLDFENRKGLFSDVDRRFRFSLVVVGPPHRERRATVAFFLQEPEEANDPHRVFPLDDEALFLFNPNSRTLSSFRTRQDYLLNRLIYERAGVFIRRDGEGGGVNPWMATPVLLFSSESSAGHLLPKKGARRGSFWTHEGKRSVPFIEAKMIHQYDHRYATYENGRTRSVDLSEKRNPFYTPEPQYLVAEERLIDRLGKLGAVPRWFLAYRNVARATDERTVIATAVPYSAVGGKAPVILSPLPAPKRLCLLANLNSLVLDYAARQKVGGTDITVQHLEQLPIFPPEAYREREMAFIVPRVLELLYTAWDLAPLVQEVWEEASEFLREVIRAWWKDAPTHPDDPPPWLEESYPFPPFLWDEERRGRIRAELDAFYARLYGLNRKQLRYVLDPKDLTERELGDLLSPEEEVEDPLEEEGYRARQARSAFHGETFRVMKEKEIRRYGFYRTRRLVLESFLALELFKSRMKVALEGSRSVEPRSGRGNEQAGQGHPLSWGPDSA